MKENESAFYVHCFVHQLQLALVAVAKSHPQIALLFNLVSIVLNIVRASHANIGTFFEIKKPLKLLKGLTVVNFQVERA